MERDAVTAAEDWAGRFRRRLPESGPRPYEEILVPRLFEPWAARLVDLMDLVPGLAVLDVACGSGTVARLAAARVGPYGQVTGCDISPEMLGLATAKPPVEGGAAIEYLQSPANALAVPDAAYDAITCQHGPPTCSSPRSDGVTDLVVGAGHNGLVAACYLAQAGREVLVVEQLDRPGGGSRTEETVPGYRFDLHSAAHNIINMTDIPVELDLAGAGLDYLEMDPFSVAIHEDGRRVRFFRSVEQTVDSIAEESPDEALAYRRFIATAMPIVGAVLPAIRGDTSVRKAAQVANVVRALRHAPLTTARDVLSPYDALLQRRLPSDLTRGPVAAFAAHAGVGPTVPGGALYAFWQAAYHRFGQWHRDHGDGPQGGAPRAASPSAARRGRHRPGRRPPIERGAGRGARGHRPPPRLPRRPPWRLERAAELRRPPRGPDRRVDPGRGRPAPPPAAPLRLLPLRARGRQAARALLSDHR